MAYWRSLIASLTLCASISPLSGSAHAFDLREYIFDPAPFYSRGPLSVGAYAGQLYKNEFTRIITAPAEIGLKSSYLAALNFDYRFLKIRYLPLQLEGEFNIAKRFGQQNEFDFSAAPFLRWTWFPWNNLVYTNVRLGIVGLSYATAISPYERLNSGNMNGSNVLHFLAPEVTFSKSESSPWEVFVRVHHRSGVFGLFNGVHGGSNYLSGGARVFFL